MQKSRKFQEYHNCNQLLASNVFMLPNIQG